MTKVKNNTHKNKQRKKSVVADPNNQQNNKFIEEEEEINSGFSSYLRSGEGAAMMKLFIIGNTLLVFLTFAWPQIQQTFTIVTDMCISVWRGINEYFRKELSSYITSEFKNPHLRLNVEKAASEAKTDSLPNYLLEPNVCLASTSIATNTKNTGCIISINPMLAKEHSKSNRLIGDKDDLSKLKHNAETSDKDPLITIIKTKDEQ